MNSPVEQNKTIQLVSALLKSNDFSKIAEVISAILLRYPSNTTLISIQAYCYYQSKDYLKASAIFASIIQDKLFKMIYAQCLYKLGKQAEACSALQIPSYPENYPAIVESILQIEFSEEKIIAAIKDPIYYIKTEKPKAGITDTTFTKIGNDRFQDLYKKPSAINIHNIPAIIDSAICVAKLGLNGNVAESSNSLSFINKVLKSPDCPNSFQILDVARIAERYIIWNHYLGRAIPFYPVNANPDPTLLKSLATLGAGFACSSEDEIQQIIDIGVSSDRIIYNQSVKFESGIALAKKYSVKKLCFDSENELEKIISTYPDADLLLRINTCEMHDLSIDILKIGASLLKAKDLIQFASKKSVNLVGICINIDCNSEFETNLHNAILESAALFKEAKEKYNISMSILDIGGGLPGTDDSLFRKLASVINEDIKSNFDGAVKVIAEPGRFIAAEVQQLVTKIIGVEEIKREPNQEPRYEYYLSTGVFQSFFSSMYNNLKAQELWNNDIIFSALSAPVNDRLFNSRIWGPSCSSIDKILDETMLPKMKTGDYLYCPHMGAYSNALRTKYIGIKGPITLYYYTKRNPWFE